MDAAQSSDMTQHASTLERPLTPQQQAALAARDVSVSLAAGAGCGKTFVLTERFISHLDPRAADAVADLDQLVAITFTDAAAREMRERIRHRCYEGMLSAADDGEAAAWQRLMRAIDGARISTIHAFCTALLRSHAVEAGLDPQFEVLDAAAAELLRLETVDDRLRALLIEQNEDVLELAAKLGLDRLRNDLSAFAGPDSEDARRSWRDATPVQVVDRWVRLFDEQVRPRAIDELLASAEVRELREAGDPQLATVDKLRAHLESLAAELEGIRTSEDALASLARLHELARVNKVCTKKDWIDSADYDRFRVAAEAFRKLIDKSPLKKSLDQAACLEAAALGLALVRLADDAAEALQAAKSQRNQLEFDDLLVEAHRLLTGPNREAVVRQADRGTRLLMVDEFQDTNQLQTSIVQAFCGDDWRERGLFAVGDFKQSIYRFNGAEPSISERLRGSLPRSGQLSLTRNFRSQPSVLDFVNAVFHGAFSNYEPLIPARSQATSTPTVEFLWAPGPRAGDDGDDAIADGSPPPSKQATGRRHGATHKARALEARWIARRLAELLQSDEPIVVEDKSENAARRLQPGDIAILLRSLSDAQVYEEALRAEGLDYYLAGGRAFYSQQEIFDILNLLIAVASNVDEIALAGALRSPLFALADETLFWLVESKGSLNAGLGAETLPAALGAREATTVRRAAAILSRLRGEKDRLLVAELLSLAIELTGFDAILQCEFLGPRKAANIQKLVEQARAHDRTSPGDLPGFITQLSEFVVRAPKEALAATQAEGNVIRLMTIHYAKGLEFPLVVLPDLERARHTGGVEPVLDPQLGPLLSFEGAAGAVGRDLYRTLENLEDLDERKRLLYVACTRAADYLILSSSIDDIDRPRSDWLQLVDQAVCLADGSLRRPLPAGYNAPQVRVTATAPGATSDDERGGRGADLQRLVAMTRELAAEGIEQLPVQADASPVDAGARRRFSFSRLSGELRAEGTRVAYGEYPRAAIGEVGAIEFGRLIHAALERVDLRRPGDVRDLCHFLAPDFVPTATQAASEQAAEMIERFLATPRARALAGAAAVRREIEFVLPWPAGPSEAEGRYLHGRLDCLYQDESGLWRLLDYKSNRVSWEDVSRAAEQYELQMLSYSLACERALGAPLAECVLVLLQPGLEHHFAWNEAARRRGADRLNAAINAAVQASP
jgi:ATP-dependent helicase/nuclease subunit A